MINRGKLVANPCHEVLVCWDRGGVAAAVNIVVSTSGAPVLLPQSGPLQCGPSASRNCVVKCGRLPHPEGSNMANRDRAGFKSNNWTRNKPTSLFVIAARKKKLVKGSAGRGEGSTLKAFPPLSPRLDFPIFSVLFIISKEFPVVLATGSWKWLQNFWKVPGRPFSFVWWDILDSASERRGRRVQEENPSIAHNPWSIATYPQPKTRLSLRRGWAHLVNASSKCSVHINDYLRRSLHGRKNQWPSCVRITPPSNRSHGFAISKKKMLRDEPSVVPFSEQNIYLPFRPTVSRK